MEPKRREISCLDARAVSCLEPLTVPFVFSSFSLLFQITCYDKSLLLYSKSNMEALNWFNCITDAIRYLIDDSAQNKKISSTSSRN